MNMKVAAVSLLAWHVLRPDNGGGTVGSSASDCETPLMRSFVLDTIASASQSIG